MKNMRLFVAVAAARSFRRAGSELGLPSSTVSRRIAELERDVGLRLFNRTTRRVELTEGGARYFETCRRIVQEAEQAYLELTQLQARPSGVIRASVPVDFSVIYLSPVLAEFARRHPAIRFDLDLTPRQADLIGDPVDFAIRMGPPKDQSLIARPIARIATALVASPAYLRGRRRPAQPQDLQDHACLRMKDAPWHLVDREGNSRVVDVGGAFVANNRGLLYQLALAGHGVAQAPEIWVEPDVKAGRLIRLMPRWSPPEVQVFAVTTTRLIPAKVRLFLDFLARSLAGTMGRPVRGRPISSEPGV
jgi:DNA-binding transcriptional LysR family regulator